MKITNFEEVVNLKGRHAAPLAPSTGRKSAATSRISDALTSVLADVFALYLKTRNFHWYLSGLHLRDYQLMMDEQSRQLLTMTDSLADCVRAAGGKSLRSLSQITQIQCAQDNSATYADPLDMLSELREDNLMLVTHLHEILDLFNAHRDRAGASLIRNYIDQTEQRSWFLFEAARPH